MRFKLTKAVRKPLTSSRTMAMPSPWRLSSYCIHLHIHTHTYCTADTPHFQRHISNSQFYSIKYFSFWLLFRRVGHIAPPMYTEVLPGGQTLALLIPSLTQFMAGMYYCSASYANTEHLEASVKIETYSKLPFYIYKLVQVVLIRPLDVVDTVSIVTLCLCSI